MIDRIARALRGRESTAGVHGGYLPSEGSTVYGTQAV